MIEMVYKGKDGNGNDEKRLPKNVRQIGEAGKGKKIYLEDYAVTYLHQVEAAVLLGETWEKDGVKYIFVHGAIQVEDSGFGDGIWEDVYRNAREYFGDSEVLGWAMQAAEQPEASDKRINQIFKTHFDREDTVLLIYEPSEKEDTVFVEENGALKKAGGYYVYYDKNKSMQEYMVHKNEGKSVEKEQVVADKAIKNFRKMSEEKKDRQGKEKETSRQPKNVRFLYAASTFLVLTIMVIAVTMINNYDKMKDMEMTLANMTMSTEPSAAANAEVKEEAANRGRASVEEEADNAEDTFVNREGGNGEDASVKDEGSDAGDALVKEEGSSGESAPVKETAGAEPAGTEQGEAKATAGETQAAGDTETEAKSVSALPFPGVSGQAEDTGKDTSAGTREAASSDVRPRQAFYTVRQGDTLVDICRMYYGTDDKLEELCTFNDITNPNSIVPGQKIKLP